MNKIRSNLGTTNIRGSSSGGPRHFEVSDESGYSDGGYFNNSGLGSGAYPSQPNSPNLGYASSGNIPQSTEDLLALRAKLTEEKLNSINSANLNDRKRIEMLTGIGRETVDVSINSHIGKLTYTLQTLKSRERKEVLKYRDVLYKTKTHDALYDVMIMTMAFSLYAIDGVELDSVIGIRSNNYNDIINARIDFISEFDDNLLTFLFSKFEELDKEAQDKYSIKKPEDVQEVAEATSKSR